MQAIARWLIVGLLLVSLPLKGLAAAGLLVCGPGHAAVGEGNRVEATPSASPHLHKAANDHGGYHHGDSTQADEQSPAQPLSPSPDDAKPPGKCTNCAPYCAALAPPLSNLSAAPSAAITEVPALIQQLRVGGLADQLERPPRLLRF